MNQDSVAHWTRQQPFRPFRLRLTDGTVHEIRHPDMIIPSRREVVVGVALPSGNPALPKINTRVFVSYFHIIQIEPIPAPVQPPGANGAGG